MADLLPNEVSVSAPESTTVTARTHALFHRTSSWRLLRVDEIRDTDGTFREMLEAAERGKVLV